MISNLISRLVYPPRLAPSNKNSAENLEAFIDSRSLEYPTRLEDEFAERVRGLGIESGMVLDVGTRVGLIALKVLYPNENFFSIGVDASSAMIDRARETANAWGLQERAFFQVGDARRMRLKSNYFDLVVSDGVLHTFDDPVSVLSEIGRVLKPKGALLIRDFRRPNRFRMSKLLAEQTKHYGSRMRPQIESAMRGAYTTLELGEILQKSSLSGARLVVLDEMHMGIERKGETDPYSWVSAREQYR